MPVQSRARCFKRKGFDSMPLLEGVTDEQLTFLGEQYENYGVPIGEVFGDGGFDEEVA